MQEEINRKWAVFDRRNERIINNDGVIIAIANKRSPARLWAGGAFRVWMDSGKVSRGRFRRGTLQRAPTTHTRHLGGRKS